MTYQQYKDKYPDATITEQEYRAIQKTGEAIGHQAAIQDIKGKLAPIAGDENITGKEKVSEILAALTSGMDRRIAEEIAKLKESQESETKTKTAKDIDLEKKLSAEIEKIKNEYSQKEREFKTKIHVSRLLAHANGNGLKKNRESDLEYFISKHVQLEDQGESVIFRDKNEDRIIMDNGKPAGYDTIVSLLREREPDIFEVRKQGMGSSAGGAPMPKGTIDRNMSANAQIEQRGGGISYFAEK